MPPGGLLGSGRRNLIRLFYCVSLGSCDQQERSLTLCPNWDVILYKDLEVSPKMN